MSNLDAINAVLISPLISILKSKTSSLLEKRDLMLKCYNEGLYHITSEENAKKILESGYLKASSNFSSYGSKKVFMFAGIPSFEEACSNVEGKSKMVAIKIKPTYEQLTEFLYRSRNDNAIAYKGDLKLTDKQIEVVYLGLYEENETFKYKEINKDQYDTYLPNFSNEKFKNKIIRKIKILKTSLEKEYLDTMNYLKNSITLGEKKEKPFVR